MKSILFSTLLALIGLAQSPVEQAVTLTRAKRYAEAQKLIDSVPQPQHLTQRMAFHRLRAAIASGLGKSSAAAAEMREALQLAPGDPSLSLATAVAEVEAGELDLALTHAKAGGETANVQFVLGGIQEKRGAFLEAAKAFQKAVELAPGNEDYRIALALEFVEHQTFEPAVEILKQGAALFPRSARIQTLLGISLYAADSPDAAISALVSALNLDPALEPAYQYLSTILLGSAASPSKPAMQALCRWNPLVCAALQIRIAREQENQVLFDTAIATLKKASPSDATARCELARAYEWRSQLPEAREQMEECVRLDPSAQNHYRLGLIYSGLGLADLARREMQLRTELLRQASAETERRLNAVQAFRYSSK